MFKKVFIEITNKCNLNCEFCTPTKKQEGFISVKDFKHVIKEVSNYTSHIYLHVLGEPLLHPQFDKLLDICLKNRVKVQITTNTSLLSNQVELKHHEAVRQINYSLHSLLQTDVDITTRIDEIIEYILSSRKDLIHCLRLWAVNENNKSAYDAIIKQISNKFEITNLNELTTGNGLKISENIYIQVEEEFEWPSLNNQVYGNSKCIALTNQIAILLDGTVVSCCLDSDGYNDFGNIYQENLDTIITSSKFITMQEELRNGIRSSKLCQRCNFNRK